MKRIKIIDRMWEDNFKPTLEEVRAVFDGKTDSNGLGFWYCYKCGGKTTQPYHQCEDVYCLECGQKYPTGVTMNYMAGILLTKDLITKFNLTPAHRK